jgi:hypothetical protein
MAGIGTHTGNNNPCDVNAFRAMGIIPLKRSRKTLNIYKGNAKAISHFVPAILWLACASRAQCFTAI